VRLTNNSASSDYRSLQLQFNRRLSRRWGAMVNYTWAKSADNLSQDSAAHALFKALILKSSVGPSDFDIRHTLTGFLSYQIPASLLRASVISSRATGALTRSLTFVLHHRLMLSMLFRRVLDFYT